MKPSVGMPSRAEKALAKLRVEVFVKVALLDRVVSLDYQVAMIVTVMASTVTAMAPSMKLLLSARFPVAKVDVLSREGYSVVAEQQSMIVYRLSP